MTLGQNIQTARKAKGMSQEALAEKIGVSRQALGKWEKDTALPGLDNLPPAHSWKREQAVFVLPLSLFHKILATKHKAITQILFTYNFVFRQLFRRSLEQDFPFEQQISTVGNT